MPPRSLALFPMMSPRRPCFMDRARPNQLLWFAPRSLVCPAPNQRLLAALLFDGERCTELASRLGVAATAVRERAGTAMLLLHRALCMAPCASEPAARVATMLVLRALDALDADEAAWIDAMLVHQPALHRAYEEYCDLVGDLCSVAPHVAPTPSVLARLLLTVDDSAAN